MLRAANNGLTQFWQFCRYCSRAMHGSIDSGHFGLGVECFDSSDSSPGVNDCAWSSLAFHMNKKTRIRLSLVYSINEWKDGSIKASFCSPCSSNGKFTFSYIYIHIYTCVYIYERIYVHLQISAKYMQP